MIGSCSELAPDLARDLVCFFSSRRVHDRGLASFLGQKLDDLIDSSGRRCLHHANREILATEAVNVELGISKSKLLADVLLHEWSRSRSERDDRRILQALQ